MGTSIVRKDTLEVSNFKFINLHPGILPQYKGTGNFWAILNKDFKNIGVSIHWMNEKIDDGEIISIVKIPLEYKSLWGMNIMAFEAGVREINNLLNNNQLLKAVVKPNVSSRYYGWYGLIEYFSFNNIQKNK